MKLNQYNPRYRQSTYWSRLLILFIVSFFGIGFIFACIAKVEEVVIARGQLQALDGEVEIKSPLSGVISEIYIKEADEVVDSQVMIRFETKLIDSKIEGIKSKLNPLNNRLDLELELKKKFKNLLEQGALSELNYIEVQKRIEKLYSEIAFLESELKENNLKRSDYIIYAPIKGKVFELIPKSSGYVSSFGETLLKIVPQGDLLAKVFVSNNDIGFIKNNMKAQVRIDAYPFTQFGELEGVLEFVGGESVPPSNEYPYSRFPAYLSLPNQFLEKNKQKYELLSGQNISVNFIVREKPVISLLSDLFLKAFDSLRGIRSDPT